MGNKLVKYLLRFPTWKKLPMLPRMYSTDYDMKDVDRDTAMLMQVTQTRCPQGVKILMERHRVKDPHILAQTLNPRKRKRDVFKRVIQLYRSFMGLTQYDPMKSQHRQYLQQDRYGE